MSTATLGHQHKHCITLGISQSAHNHQDCHIFTAPWVRKMGSRCLLLILADSQVTPDASPLKFGKGRPIISFSLEHAEQQQKAKDHCPMKQVHDMGCPTVSQQVIPARLVGSLYLPALSSISIQACFSSEEPGSW